MQRTIWTIVATMLCGLFANSATAQEWGTLKGRFVFKGTAPTAQAIVVTKDPEACGQHNLTEETLVVGSNGELANVVLYVRSKVTPHPDYAEAEQPVVDNKNCRFEPHITIVQVGKPALIKNSDPVGHNVNLQPPGDQPINPQLQPGASVEHTFRRAQLRLVPVNCNIHPWMRGYVLPRDNPYFAVSAADGTFEIKNLPVGEIEFQALHEKPGFLELSNWPRGRFKMTINPGENDLGDIEVPASVFN